MGYTRNPRYIPVVTGNTNDPFSKRFINPVHPRGHGEHLIIKELLILIRGTSPWSRGTRFTAPKTSQQRRYIPVVTGNT